MRSGRNPNTLIDDFPHRDPMNNELLSTVIAGLSVESWIRLVVVWIAALAALLLLKWLIVGRVSILAKRTKNQIDDMLVAMLDGTRKVFLGLVALLIAVQFVSDEAPALAVIRRVVFLGALVQAGLWVNHLVRFWSEWYVEKQGDHGKTQVTAVNALGLAARILLWSILAVLTLDNFGVDITALVAGLGIGGIAIALAVQNVLQDLLAYVSIVVDKPFSHGDYLVMGEYSGTVEHIGIKSTRLRSISGEQLIFSNNDLLGSRIRNYRRMYERRVSIEIGVTYDTPRAILEQIPQMIQTIVESEEDVRFNRSHMTSFGDSAILFQTIYHMTNPDYTLHMDRRQAINLNIHKVFEDKGIEFAFPTQTIHIESFPSAVPD